MTFRIRREWWWIKRRKYHLMGVAFWSAVGFVIGEGAGMTREKAIERLKSAQENGDTEAAHSDADDVLCALLIALGYRDVIEEWSKVDKWYA